MVLLSTLIGSMASTPWSVISAIIAAAAFTVIFHVNIIRPRLRRRRLRIPVDAFFVIPGPGRHCDYAEQDGDEHQTKEIVLPTNTEVVVQLLYKPRLAFRTTQIYFGCEPISASGQKPIPFEFYNTFLLQGRRRHIVPSDDTDDELDTHGFYHSKEARSWSVGSFAANAFKIRTGSPGTYAAMTHFTGDDVAGCAKLVIRVEESPHTEVRCLVRDHRRKQCSRGIRPRIAPTEKR